MTPAPVPQSAEGDGLKPSKCGFESHRGHIPDLSNIFVWRGSITSQNDLDLSLVNAGIVGDTQLEALEDRPQIGLR